MKKPLNPQKICVWCALSPRCLVGHMSLTVDSEMYQHIITHYISMSEDNKHHCWLQQDGATCHTYRGTTDSPKVNL